MNAGRILGAVAAATAAGLGLSVLTLRIERLTRSPNELVVLQRGALRQAGRHVRPDHQLPTVGEQVTAQGGHLAFSALAGAAYAATVSADTGVVRGGFEFGLAFYALAHWLVGPALGVKAPEWRSPPKAIALHALNHVLFGLVTAAGARAGRG